MFLVQERGRTIACFADSADAKRYLYDKKERVVMKQCVECEKAYKKEHRLDASSTISQEEMDRIYQKFKDLAEEDYCMVTDIKKEMAVPTEARTYAEMKKQHQEEFNKFPLGAAFDAQQFEAMMQKWGLDAREKSDRAKVTHLCAGVYMQKKDILAYNEMIHRHRAELKAAIAADATGEGFIREMFYTELMNNEYGYTGSCEDTLSAMGYTPEDFRKESRLAHGLSAAAQEIMKEEGAIWEPAEMEAGSEAMEAEELPEMVME